MKLKNPLRNYLTPNEQRIMLFFLGFLLLGSVLDFAGWTPLQATKADADSLNLALKTDTPLRVDIRKAGLEELMTLSGIGEKRAKDIISFREAKQFTSVNQLLEVKGIGTKTYAKLLPDLLVFGDSTNSETKAKPSAKSKTKSSNNKAKVSKADLTNFVNLNTASLDDLCTLQGIGEAKAKAIIAWREENGAFGSVEDFTKVKGIGLKTLEKNRDRLSVNK